PRAVVVPRVAVEPGALSFGGGERHGAVAAPRAAGQGAVRRDGVLAPRRHRVGDRDRPGRGAVHRAQPLAHPREVRGGAGTGAGPAGSEGPGRGADDGRRVGLARAPWPPVARRWWRGGGEVALAGRARDSGGVGG